MTGNNWESSVSSNLLNRCTCEIRYSNKHFEIFVSKIFRVFKIRSPASLRNFRDNENFSNYGTSVWTRVSSILRAEHTSEILSRVVIKATVYCWNWGPEPTMLTFSPPLMTSTVNRTSKHSLHHLQLNTFIQKTGIWLGLPGGGRLTDYTR